MDTTNLMLLVSVGGLIVFVVVIRLALGPQFFFPPPSRNPMNSANWQLYSEPERPWVPRARAALAGLPPPHRAGELTGWTWQAVDRHPTMTVHVDETASDERRISGGLTGTPGTLAVTCRAPTSFRLVDGWITLTPEGSQDMTLRAGDSLVLQPGFSGLWRNETIARLTFEVSLF